MITNGKIVGLNIIKSKKGTWYKYWVELPQHVFSDQSGLYGVQVSEVLSSEEPPFKPAEMIGEECQISVDRFGRLTDFNTIYRERKEV